MPIHDWTRVDAGIFHAFHYLWIASLYDVLNGGLLPEGYYALPEQNASGFIPDLLALQQSNPSTRGGPAIATRPQPKTRFTADSADTYRRKKNVIAVRHISGDRTVAIVELVSPGNKSSQHALQAFLAKTRELIQRKIHLLIVDLFPPTPRDPDGIHGAIWSDIEDAPFELPPESPLTLVAYECGDTTHAYIEPVAVGQSLPSMPLFLEPGAYVDVPLDETYTSTFRKLPGLYREILEAPAESR